MTVASRSFFTMSPSAFWKDIQFKNAKFNEFKKRYLCFSETQKSYNKKKVAKKQALSDRTREGPILIETATFRPIHHAT